jgi:chromosome segregation ATPase
MQAMNGPTGTNGGMVSSQEIGRRVMDGLKAVQEVEQERDEGKAAIAKLTVELRGLNAEHDALKVAYARAQGEVEGYRYERDQAVEKRARADVLIDAVLTLLAKHRGQPLESELAAAGPPVEAVKPAIAAPSG